MTYAQRRYILVIPEIDLPGRTNAALACYADLNCEGEARSLYTDIQVGFSYGGLFLPITPGALEITSLTMPRPALSQ